MAQYRIYQVDPQGHISTPPEVVACEGDQEAAEKAAQFVNGSGVEVWELDRLVIRLPAADPQ
jgi:hypothetical protein